jgi:hypothetical protein
MALTLVSGLCVSLVGALIVDGWMTGGVQAIIEACARAGASRSLNLPSLWLSLPSPCHMKELSSDAKNATAAASSSGFANRPIGM